MEYDVIKKLWNRIPGYIRIAFVSGMVTGLVTHFYMLTHKLPNWDDANNLAGYGAGRDIGRWMLYYIHSYAGDYSVPAVHGFVYILNLTIAACIVLGILELRSSLAAVLVPAVMVTFPSVASTFAFMFTIHDYGLAIIMMCLAVYLLRKYEYGFIATVFLLIGGLGIYQSYISIAIALMLMGMVCDMLRGGAFKKNFYNGVKCALVLIVAAVVYIAVCHLMYPNIENTQYAGVGNMGKIAITEMPRLIARCYKRFLEYFLWKPFEFVSGFAQIINVCVCVMLGLIFVYLLFVKKIYKDIYRLVLTVMFMFFLPWAAAFVYFMAPEAPYSMLMLYAYCLVYVMLIALMELCMKHWSEEKTLLVKKIYWRKGCVLLVAVLVTLSCYTDYLLSNEAYFRTEIAKDRVVSYFTRMISRVEEQEGFSYGDKVTFMGEFHYLNNPSPLDDVEDDSMDFEYLRAMSGVALENGLVTSGVRNNFIRTYIGFEMYDMTDSERAEIMESEIYKEMPLYPAQGSIQKMQDIWVVKLCE